MLLLSEDKRSHPNRLDYVGSIMKCNTLESERDFVILRMYAQKIPTTWTEGA